MIAKPQYCSLEQLGSVSRGRSQYRPRNAPHLYGGKYPFIQTAEITRSNLYIMEYSQTYSELGLQQSKLWGNDTLCIVNAGVNTGDNAILKFKSCFPDSIIGFRATPDKCDVRFVKYYLDSIKNQIKTITMGATQDNLSVAKLLTFKIPIVPLSTQKKIAAILSAYDDLIENNKRRIALLEKMAEEIYREWFVRFRFPGYEKVKFVKGVPKGWNVKKVRNIVSFYIGGGWGEEEQSSTFNEGAYVIRGTDIPKIDSGDLSEKIYRYHKASNYKSRKLEPDDFVFEVSGGSKNQLLGRNLFVTKGLLNYFENKLICASFCKLLRFKNELISPYLMKYYLKLYYDCELVGIYQTQSTGISNYHFESFLSFQDIIIPPRQLQNRFDEMIVPLLNLKDNLSLKMTILKKSRDSLLGRLISGKLSVENLDIQFPPSMQTEEET